jgi:hypothetical protein
MTCEPVALFHVPKQETGWQCFIQLMQLGWELMNASGKRYRSVQEGDQSWSGIDAATGLVVRLSGEPFRKSARRIPQPRGSG